MDICFILRYISFGWISIFDVNFFQNLHDWSCVFLPLHDCVLELLSVLHLSHLDLYRLVAELGYLCIYFILDLRILLLWVA